MIKIAIIVPKDLVNIGKVAAANFQEDIHIIEGSMERGVDLAKEYENKGFDVIVARGGTELLLKKIGFKIPIIPIPIDVMDIYNSINEAKKETKLIGILAFNNMIASSESYMKISGEEYLMMQVTEEKDVRDNIEYMAKKGIEVVVGGGIVSRYAQAYNIKSIVIKTGKESIATAIEEARRVALALREENKRGARFRTIVENARNGIISVDKEGVINIFNTAAEILLNMNHRDILGKHVEDVFPNLDLMETLQSGIADTDQIKEIKDKKLIVTNIPIKINGEVVDAVSMVQDTDKIQQMEEQIRRENSSVGLFARYTFNDVIGVSKTMKETVRIAKEYAKVNSTILIEGETGTGKEVIVQSIHNYSARSHGPFVAINCAALSDTLLESELFGYTAGSFTGADKKGKRGLFELAHGGTIFLDEI